MFHMKKYLCMTILLLLIFNISACMSNEKLMETKKPSTENSIDVDSSISNSLPETTEISPAYQAYISVLEAYEAASKDSCSTYDSTLADLDGDGQEELLFFYLDDSISAQVTPMVAYQIWSFKDDMTVLLARENLFLTAGDPYGGLSVVEFDGKKYFCAWYFNGYIDIDYDYLRYEARLYEISAKPFSLKDTFVFENYYDNEDGYYLNANPDTSVPRQPVLEMGKYYHNCKEITSDEYLYYWDIFDNITLRFLDTVSYWDDHAGVPAYQLISYMKNI